MKLTSDEVIKLVPHFYYRQDATYLTGEYIPKVYRWYSNRFGLGSAPQGQNNCISMSSREVQFRITKIRRVTVCDTINGRMIFDQRTIELK